MKHGENKFPEGSLCLVVNIQRKEWLGKKVTIAGWMVSDEMYLVQIEGEAFQRKCQQECLKLLEYPLYVQHWLQVKMAGLLSPNPQIAAQLVEERNNDGRL